jgi:hypothetical protein
LISTESINKLIKKTTLLNLINKSHQVKTINPTQNIIIPK